MSNIGSYEERVKDFDWSIAEKELGYKAGEVINIGWYCSDRICEMGKGDKPALLWEGSAGEEKRYTYDDIRVYSNTHRRLPARPGREAARIASASSWIASRSCTSACWGS